MSEQKSQRTIETHSQEYEWTVAGALNSITLTVGVTRNKVKERVDVRALCNECISYGPRGNNKMGMAHGKLCFSCE